MFKDTDSKFSEFESKNAQNEVLYFDLYEKFMKVVYQVDRNYMNGCTPKQIASRLKETIPAYYSLCMMENIKEASVRKKKQKAVKLSQDAEKPLDDANLKATKAKEESSQTAEQPKKMKRPQNFLVIREGWGLCPSCKCKVIRVKTDTVLKNFPVYCKKCKAEYVVNWWNVEKVSIEYKRYVNENHLKDQALKGTSLSSYLKTGCSSTEKTAMKYYGS